MKKAPYSYIFYICITIVSFAVLITGITIYIASSKIYKQTKLNEISKLSQVYIEEIKNEFTENNSLEESSLEKTNSIYNTSYDIQFVLYDSNGKCIIPKENPSISESIRSRLDESYYFDYDSDKVSVNKPTICYGQTFMLDSSTYYMLAYMPSDSMNSFSQKLMISFITVFAIIFALCSVIFLWVIKNLNKPILEIKRITQNYAKGDFSERLPHTENDDFKSIYMSLNKMADFIATNENTSKSFIANVSHELRTPMTTIGGFVDGMLDGVIPKSKQHEYLSLVSQEIKRLRVLVSSMLNMTKFESGTMKPNFKETNINQLIIKTILMFEQKLENKNIDVQGLDADKITLIADADLIEQVIYNLVENAVKFVDENGVISFNLTSNDTECSIGIRNTGEGLTNDEISQVFDRFYKTDSSRGKDTTGLGLGLSISRKIIHLHNGQIMVKSVHGEYTEFIITLPLKNPSV